MGKCKCPPVGAPDWVLTYGDMMSLLLCFFILLAALSELKKPEQFNKAVAEVQAAFGQPITAGKLSLIERLRDIQLKNPNLSESEDAGVEGREPAVTRVREGMVFTQGGLITFEPGSADLSEQGTDGLRRIAVLIRGYNNKIELRGHAAPAEGVVGSAYPDTWSLSFARAKAVMDFLTQAEQGLRPEQLRLIANGDGEPLVRRVYGEKEQAANRRVEILVTDNLVNEFRRPERR